MPLKKLQNLEPDYLETLGGTDIIGLQVYTEGTNEKVGSVKDILLDESGIFRYLVVDFGLWIFNKQVILPVGRSRIDYEAQRVYVLGLNRRQAEALPQYEDRLLVDYDYEEQVREVYRTLAGASLGSEDAAIRSITGAPPQPDTPSSSHAAYSYQQDPGLYEMNQQDHGVLKQYQDQLMAQGNKPREAVLGQPVATPAQGQPVIQPLDAGSIPNESPTRSACLIFNPVAGQSDAEQDLATIKRLLEPEFNLDIRTTTPDVDAAQLAQEAVERGVEMIIASGGDGTLSAAAEAVVGTGIPLGVISRGTANAFANALKIPVAIEAACETILTGVTRVVDAAYCNGKPMVLLAGIGFEAETVERADREAKNRFGMLAYIMAGVQSLRDLKSFEARIETEDKIITLDAAAVTIANAAPPTSVLAQGPAELLVDDGFLDVTLVAPANSMSAIAAAYNLLQSARSAATTDRPDTGFLRARSIKVSTNPPQKVVLDGELIGYTPVEVECIPGGLTILVPASSQEKPTEKLEGLPNLRVELKED